MFLFLETENTFFPIVLQKNHWKPILVVRKQCPKKGGSKLKKPTVPLRGETFEFRSIPPIHIALFIAQIRM